MAVNIDYDAFLRIINDNPTFQFEKLNNPKRLSSQSCAFYAYAKDSFVTCTSLPDEDVYNIRIFDDINRVETSMFVKDATYLVSHLDHNFGLSFNDDRIHRHLNTAFKNIVDQIIFIEKFYPAEYNIKLVLALEFYFDRKTNEYRYCEFQLTFNLVHPLNSNKLTITKSYQLNGIVGKPLSIDLFSLLSASIMSDSQKLEMKKVLQKYSDVIPEDHGLRTHWVYAYDGKFEDDLDTIHRGMEVAQMNIELKDMVDYMDK